MASVWKFASTRGLIFLADAQSADPKELHVLDPSLPKNESIVRACSPIIAPRHTEGSLKMTPLLCLRHTQQCDI